jgi:hypothetical protein
MISLTSDFIALGYKQAETCRENPEVYLSCLVKFGSQRSVIMTAYNALVAAGRMVRIEDQDQERKIEYWQTAKALAADKLDPEKTKILARCLYCLDWLLGNS